MADTRPYHIVSGLLVPKFILQEEVDKLKNFILFPDDVFIATYPKCGTTWTQQIVKLIRNNGERNDIKIDKSVPWLESLKVRHPDFKIEELPRPRTFKTHFPYHLLPCGPPHTTPCKYIFVVRNPKDVAVSLFFHYKKLHFPNLNWDTFWKEFIEGGAVFGDYFDQLLGWWPHRTDENVLFLKYEDMKKDLQLAVGRIASFIGADLSSDIISKIADLSNFERMKDDDAVNHSWKSIWMQNGKSVFMRKGIVGDWKNFLSLEQSAEMDAICADRLKDTGLEFDYEL